MGLQVAIEYDRKNASYRAGETVTGKIILICNEETKILGLKVTFKGEGSVRWTEQKRVQHRFRHSHHANSYDYITIVYEDDETYFNHTTYLLYAGTETIVKEGSTSYPFHYTLPSSKLPTSFYGDYGSISYFVEAYASNNNVTRHFMISNPVDISRNPRTKTPLSMGDDVMLCCCCCKNGPICFFLTTHKSGFNQGESIGVNVQLTNKSMNNVNSVELALVQDATFMVHGKSTNAKRVVVAVHRKGLEPQTPEDHWRGDLLKIPNDCPPSGGCKLIKVNYELRLTMAISGRRNNLQCSGPIFIGTPHSSSKNTPKTTPKTTPKNTPKNSPRNTPRSKRSSKRSKK